MPDITIETVNQGVAEMRRAHEEFQKGVLCKADFETTQTKINAKLDEVEKKATEAEKQNLANRLADVETKLSRPPVAEEKKDPHEAEHKAFMRTMRKGREALGPEELKVMRIADDTTGGFMTSPDIESGIIKENLLFSPIRGLAKVRQTSKGEVWARKRTGTFAATWRGESGTRNETTGLKYGLEKLPVHEMYADSAWTTQDLDDSDFNLEAELTMEFGEQFGIAEGKAFVTGDGKNKPEGILTNSTVLANKVAGDSAGALSITDVTRLVGSLKTPYVSGASILTRRETIYGSLILFKDSANHYIWMPSMQQGVPSTILGISIVETVDMPIVAANAYAMCVGNWRMAYEIVDRVGISVLRDPYSLKNYGQVEFTATKRIGGQVILPDAIKILQIHS
jgi:HK97 family phage major capsid protein